MGEWNLELARKWQDSDLPTGYHTEDLLDIPQMDHAQMPLDQYLAGKIDWKGYLEMMQDEDWQDPGESSAET